MSKKSKANARYERFAREYVIDRNGTRAAIAAGYKRPSARVTACRLLTQANIQELIAGFAAKAAAKLEITAERVLGEIARLAFVDPRKFFRKDGSAIPIHELDEDTAAALASIDVVEVFKDRKFVGYTKKFKFVDKGQNLERLARYLQLFKDRVEISGAVNGPKSLAELAAAETPKSLAELAAQIRREWDDKHPQTPQPSE